MDRGPLADNFKAVEIDRAAGFDANAYSFFGATNVANDGGIELDGALEVREMLTQAVYDLV